MAIRKRRGNKGNTYQIDYFDPTGMRIRRSFKKKKDAEAELAKRISLRAEGRYLDIKKDFTTTLVELLDKYEENYKDQASFIKGKRYYLPNFRAYFGKDKLLSNIKYIDLEMYHTHLKRKLTRHGTKRKGATINREMICLQHIFSKAIEWDMIEEDPFKKGRRFQVKENNKRLRFLSEKEIDNLLSVCPEPLKKQKTIKGLKVIQGLEASYLKGFIIIALNTGMRKGEILSLKFEQKKDGFIYLTDTKTDERQIPVTNDLEECFEDIKKRRQLKTGYIFSNKKGGHIQDIKTSFKSTLKRAGIKDFRPHDLRHTFASHYIMRGGSLKALKEILGHNDIKMTMRYAHLSKEFAKEEIQLINGLTSRKKSEKKKNNVTKWSQI